LFRQEGYDLIWRSFAHDSRVRKLKVSALVLDIKDSAAVVTGQDVRRVKRPICGCYITEGRVDGSRHLEKTTPFGRRLAHGEADRLHESVTRLFILLQSRGHASAQF
jgi:hypothetical protein